MGTVIPFPLRAHRKTSGDVDAVSLPRQGAPDCLWNSAEPPAADIFDKMVARIRVARCYMLCETQLSLALQRQPANVSPSKHSAALEPKCRLYLISPQNQSPSTSSARHGELGD
jgi:hypothetical protein